MITNSIAKKAIEVAEKKATELGIKVSTVIVDEHGTPIAMSRMDGAFVVSPKFAESKAFTSATLGLPSGDIAEYAADHKPYFGINTGWGGIFLPIAGGFPVTDKNKKVIGGVGVGGSLDTKQDAECAQDAVDEIHKLI